MAQAPVGVPGAEHCMDWKSESFQSTGHYGWSNEVGAAWLLYRGKRRAALVLLIASFSGRLLVILEKAYFARLRPEEHLRLAEVHYQSFPSGHAANSMIVYLLLALFLIHDPQRRAIAVGAALLLSILIGISRVLLGVQHARQPLLVPDPDPAAAADQLCDLLIE